MTAGMYAHIRSSPIDHMVREVRFGGTILLWCDWSTDTILTFTTAPRSKNRVCHDCRSAKLAAVKKETQEKLRAAPPIDY